MASEAAAVAVKAYNYEELAQPTMFKSWAVKGAGALLILSITNDIYKKRVAQGAAHLFCLGTTWILHNAIWVKDLEDLVPVLGATAQRYSEEIDRLSESVFKLEAATDQFRGLSADDIAARTKKLEEERAELAKLQEQQTRLQGAIDLLGDHVQGVRDVLHSPHVRALSQHPKQVAEMLKAAVAERCSENAEANQLAGRLVEIL